MRTYLSRIVVLLYFLSLFFFLRRIDATVETSNSLFYFNLMAYFALFAFSYKRLRKERKLLGLFVTEGILLSLIILYRGTLAGASLVPFFSVNLQLLICYGASLKRLDYLAIFVLTLLSAFYFSVHNVMDLNGNNVGFIWICLGIYLILLIPADRFVNYVIIGLIFAVVSGFVLMSESRSSLLAFLLFFIAKLLPLSFFRNRRLYKLACLALTFGSLLYMQLYILLYLSPIDMNQIFSFLPSTKDFFSGRQIIWMAAHSLLYESPLTGVGGVYELLDSELDELHNSVLCLYFFFGYIVATLMLILMNRILFEASLYIYKNNYVKDGVMAFLAFLLLGFNENTVIAFSICFLSIFIAYSEINKYKYSQS